MNKNLLIKLLSIILVSLLAINILVALVFFYLTSTSSYKDIFADKEFFDSVTDSIFIEAKNDLSNSIQKDIADQTGIDANDSFTRSVIDAVSKTVVESNINAKFATFTEKNIDSFLNYINNDSEEILIYLPKSEIDDFIDVSIPILVDELSKIILENELCDVNGRCISDIERQDLELYVENELRSEVDKAIGDFRNLDLVYSNGNEYMSLDDLSANFPKSYGQDSLDEIENAFKITRTARNITYTFISLFTIANILILLAILLIRGGNKKDNYHYIGSVLIGSGVLMGVLSIILRLLSMLLSTTLRLDTNLEDILSQRVIMFINEFINLDFLVALAIVAIGGTLVYLMKKSNLKQVEK